MRETSTEDLDLAIETVIEEADLTLAEAKALVLVLCARAKSIDMPEICRRTQPWRKLPGMPPELIPAAEAWANAPNRREYLITMSACNVAGKLYGKPIGRALAEGKPPTTDEDVDVTDLVSALLAAAEVVVDEDLAEAA